MIKSGMRRSCAIPQAVKIDPNLAEAYLGWGFCLVNLKKYEAQSRHYGPQSG